MTRSRATRARPPQRFSRRLRQLATGTGEKVGLARAAEPVPRRPPAGVSLVETLVAGALLLVILLALLPLLERARLVVEAGGRAARLGSLTSAALEGRLGAGLREAADGAPVLAFYSRSRHEWLTRRPPPPDVVLWERVVEVRRYLPRALDDGRLDPAEALDPEDDLPGPLLWEVAVRVDGGAAVLAGGRRGASLRLLRAF